MDIDADLWSLPAPCRRSSTWAITRPRWKATLDREEALRGADYVVVILAGGLDIGAKDIRIPKKYGIDINIGDTRPSGIAGAAHQ